MSVIKALILGIVILCFLASSKSYGISTTNNSGNNDSAKINNKSTDINPEGTVPSRPLLVTGGITLPELFSKVKNSVVEINVKIPNVNPHIIVNGTPLQNIEIAHASGFIYDTDGHVVTNAHVVLGANSVDVTFLDGDSYSASIVGHDVYSDLAVLKIDDPSVFFREQINPLPLANSSEIEVGQQVAAVGNPLGLTGSMTQGIVSQLDRVRPDAYTGRFYVAGLIQTDALITHGNSGGPLLNLDGQVIGVTEQGQQSQEVPNLEVAGISYAIPSNTVQNVIPQLIKYGTFKHAWLGVHVIDVSPDIAKVLSLKEARGVIVISISAGSPAQAAGISAGTKAIVLSNQQINSNADIILAVDQKLVKGISDLINYVDTKTPGDHVQLKVFRSDGAVHDIDVQLAQRPAAG